MFEEINIRVKQIHDNIGLKKDLENKLTTAWLNVNKNGGYNIQHNHLNACFSGTYYLKGIESGAEGNIVFKIPKPVVWSYPASSAGTTPPFGKVMVVVSASTTIYPIVNICLSSITIPLPPLMVPREFAVLASEGTMLSILTTDW